MRADKSACRADSVLTACCCCRAGPRQVAARCSCSSCSRASATSRLPPVRLASWLCRFEQARFVGRGQRIAVGRQAFAADVELARLLFDVALVGGQHLNLLLHLRDAGALLVGARLGLAQRLFQIGQGLRLLFHLGGQHLGLFFASMRLVRPASRSRPGRPPCAWPTGRSVPSAWTRRCSTRWRPSTTKRISASSRPTSALASYSRPWAWLTWSPAA